MDISSICVKSGKGFKLDPNKCDELLGHNKKDRSKIEKSFPKTRRNQPSYRISYMHKTHTVF